MAPVEGSPVRVVAPNSAFRGLTGAVVEEYAAGPEFGVRMDSGLFVVPVMRFAADEVEFLDDTLATHHASLEAMPGTRTITRGNDA